MKLVRGIGMLGPAMCDSAAILRRHKFTEAFGMGGSEDGAVLLMPVLKRIPVVIFEPNAAPGFANRILARFATRIATGYEETARAWGPKAVVTRCPVRAEFQD